VTAKRRHIVIILMLLSASLAAIIFRPLRDAGGFHIPSSSEASGARRMFASALSGGERKELGAASKEYGLRTRKVQEENWRGLSLAEVDENCQGRGTYLLRDETHALPVALMAPHRGADRRTGELTAMLFSEHPVAAAAWNSAPRRPGVDCNIGGDVTRVDTHFFTAFSLAFADRFPEGRIIQIHGFEKNLRKSAAARRADIIVSNGSDAPGEALLILADCLRENMPDYSVSVYPIDTNELGALQNRQGRALRASGFGGFTHIEISAELRRSLVEDPQLRASFARCLSVATQ
jgi:hypothetical protein